MAAAFRISNVTARALADQFETMLDTGAGNAILRIYDGTQPTDPDTAIGAQVLLAELTFSDPAFGAAADAAPGGRITANAITQDSSADATGTASWFRMFRPDGTTAVADGSVGTSLADLIVNTVAFTAGSTVQCSSATITMPES